MSKKEILSMHDQISKDALIFIKKKILNNCKKQVSLKEFVQLTAYIVASLNINLLNSIHVASKSLGDPMSLDTLKNEFERIRNDFYEQTKKETNDQIIQ